MEKIPLRDKVEKNSLLGLTGKGMTEKFPRPCSVPCRDNFSHPPPMQARNFPRAEKVIDEGGDFPLHYQHYSQTRLWNSDGTTNTLPFSWFEPFLLNVAKLES